MRPSGLAGSLLDFPLTPGIHTALMPAIPEVKIEHGLVRGLRRLDLVALVLNVIIGAGIFGLSSQAFALAGAYSVLAYLVCAVPILLIVLCFAEVSSRFSATGGLYLYAREAFGPVVGFEIGWLAWLTRLTGFAALCNLFADYMGYFFSDLGSGMGRLVVIGGVVSGLTAANIAGLRAASWFSNILTVAKLVPLLLLIVAGFSFIDIHTYTQAPPPTYTAFSASVLLLVFAFTGFEMVGIPAGEARDPRRHLPFAFLAGAGAAVLLYISIQAVCIATVTGLATSRQPLADAGGSLHDCRRRVGFRAGYDARDHAFGTAAPICDGGAGATTSNHLTGTSPVPDTSRRYSAFCRRHAHIERFRNICIRGTAQHYLPADYIRHYMCRPSGPAPQT